jgi:hypothetical protein
LIPRYGEVGWYRDRKLSLVWNGLIDQVSFEGRS